MNRSLACRSALAAALAALAACSAPTTRRCPGAPIATLRFTGTLDAAGCDGGEPTGGFSPLVPAQIAFVATVSDAGGGAAAVCREAPLAEPLTGTLAGDALTASLTSGAGVLSGCADTCTTVTVETLQGQLTRDGGGAVTGFAGTLQDDITAAEVSSCGACGMPCHAHYVLAGAPPPG